MLSAVIFAVISSDCMCTIFLGKYFIAGRSRITPELKNVDNEYLIDDAT